MKNNEQSPLVHVLTDYLQANPAALALALFGSMANATADAWSDTDAILVIQDQALPGFFPGTVWLRAFGDLFATEQYDNDATKLLRVCFSDFRRLDLVIVTECSLKQIANWPSPPPWQRAMVIFARAPEVNDILEQPRQAPPFRPATQADVEAMINQFWFKATMAVHKTVRDDRLIALHLTLDLIRDCAVLGMMIRDRATGSNQHRHGGIGNEMVERLPTVEPPYTAVSLLVAIGKSGRVFDQLAAQWSSDYAARGEFLTAHINKVLKN